MKILVNEKLKRGKSVLLQVKDMLQTSAENLK